MRSGDKGFSLIELMITVAIMGILSAIAIPAYQNYIEKARTVDLMTASHLGQLMVSEYIQTSSATNCATMPGIPPTGYNVIIPVTSSNIGDAEIYTATDNEYPSCTVIVSGVVQTANADQLGWIPEIQVASYDDIAIENNVIPNVQLAAHTNGPPTFVSLYSIPTFNQDGSISWTMYSNGAKGAPASLPNISTWNGR